MFILNKYKQNTLISYENINILKNLKNNKKINYVFTYKSKFIRNFIFFYSIFLTTNQFSSLFQKNNPEFNFKINPNYLLLLNNDYNLFFNLYK